MVFLCVDNAVAVMHKIRACSVFDEIGIKNKCQIGLGKRDIIAENIHQALPRFFKAEIGDLAQVVPCVNDVIAVDDDHAVVFDGCFFMRTFAVLLGGIYARLAVAPTFDGAKFAQHDRFKLLVGKIVFLGKSARLWQNGFAWGEAYIGCQVFVLFYLVPWDNYPRPVCAKD